MLPGKKYTPEDLLRILRRRFWLIVVPFAVISAAVAIYARKLPDVFRSDTLILVVPQRVPESYVKSTVTAKIEDRLQSITQQIMSRTRLERIITDFNLYEQERKTKIMEDIVERMRTRDVQVQVVKGDAFRVSFSGGNPRTVMKVTDRLASLFIEENLRDREVQAEGTNQFLEAQLEEARRRLVEHEQKLEEFRSKHAGELPEQLESNMQAITNINMQIQQVVQTLNQDRNHRLTLERTLADLEALPDVEDGPAAAPSPSAPTSGTVQQRLAAARNQLKALEQRYTSEFPDVKTARRLVRDLEQAVAAQEADTPLSDSPEPPRKATREQLTRFTRAQSIRAEIEQVDRQIKGLQQEEQRLRKEVAAYRMHTENIPARQSEMTEITRDYDTLREQYGKLVEKKEDSKIAANLERRQIGEQFKLLDPARLPEKPFSPNRQQLNMIGMAVGLAVALAIVALLEYRDSSLKTDDDVVFSLSLPVLAVIPKMLSKTEGRRQFRRQVVLGIGLGSTVMVCLGLLVYTFVR
jgi:polysaccharide chain length determinant protein (PEP-CTERM system associated)